MRGMVFDSGIHLGFQGVKRAMVETWIYTLGLCTCRMCVAFPSVAPLLSRSTTSLDKRKKKDWGFNLPESSSCGSKRGKQDRQVRQTARENQAPLSGS
jgi:hypothetical protein